MTRTSSVVTFALLLSAGAAGAASPEFVQNGRAGFVVTGIRYALGDDAAQTGACPRGMSLNVAEIYAATPEGKRRKGEPDDAYSKRVEAGGRAISAASNGRNVCANPEAAPPDPHYRSLESAKVVADGIDLDAVDSNAQQPAAGGMCPHQDFVGRNGQRGVDNQFFRVVGCNRSFQSTGQSNGFGIGMLTGSWGILITLDGVDDIRNDDDVEVGFVSNADPIQLSPTREPLAYATYAMHQDPRYRSSMRGRIKDGVLTTDPVDVRFYTEVNSLFNDRPLKRARLHMTLSETGVIEGFLAGYTPVESVYDMQFGFRNARNAAGEPGPQMLRLHTANGAARVLGYTCQGAYQSLYQHADADPDPQTGRCSSLSTQYHIKAVPAFVVDVKTQSANDKLIQASGNAK
ncbi:hypothetical protein [Steroidobacter agaridevorans]|uniref:hypothetical protein n=1 Tax=Steroidobacter agaridevorans TaxID=2695856 RepID=UPI001320F4EE|nr:hypothetical protein [Steroidobacter agaridevorans]GFE87665.1 hypothetical protein GCM10011488_26190 [Steroidobacter agaridevorans]